MTTSSVQQTFPQLLPVLAGDNDYCTVRPKKGSRWLKLILSLES